MLSGPGPTRDDRGQYVQRTGCFLPQVQLTGKLVGEHFPIPVKTLPGARHEVLPRRFIRPGQLAHVRVLAYDAATYGKLAADLGSAPRAVGQACGANPFPLIVPCHRVTSAAGLGGFANAREGWLLEVKRWLLAFEGAL